MQSTFVEMSDTTSDEEDSTQYSARLALSESDLAELEAALSALSAGEVSRPRSSLAPYLRFHSTVLVLLTVGLATLTLTVVQTSESAVVQHLSGIGVVLLVGISTECCERCVACRQCSLASGSAYTATD